MSTTPPSCPKRTERHRRLRGKIRTWRFSRYLSPRYHVRKFLEDIKSTRAALKMWQLDKAEDENSLRNAIRGKLFGTYLAGGLFAGTGPPVAYGVQLATGNAFLGVVCGNMWAIVVGLLAFQSIWSFTNKDFYERRYGGFVARWKAMLIDLWPMQKKSIYIALGMNVIMLPLAKIVVVLFEWILPGGIRFLPIPFLITLTEAVLINSTLLRLMGDLFDRHSRTIARRHAGSLGQGA